MKELCKIQIQIKIEKLIQIQILIQMNFLIQNQNLVITKHLSKIIKNSHLNYYPMVIDLILQAIHDLNLVILDIIIMIMIIMLIFLNIEIEHLKMIHNLVILSECKLIDQILIMIMIDLVIVMHLVIMIDLIIIIIMLDLHLMLIQKILNHMYQRNILDLKKKYQIRIQTIMNGIHLLQVKIEIKIMIYMVQEEVYLVKKVKHLEKEN
mmetsp:Transcript_22739/g.27994  ORF Transcript_22739/g.27994 Transcript_22739/m.27994 type:complete len:208 (+) Transcript_22739:75-698(+)